MFQSRPRVVYTAAWQLKGKILSLLRLYKFVASSVNDVVNLQPDRPVSLSTRTLVNSRPHLQVTLQVQLQIINGDLFISRRSVKLKCGRPVSIFIVMTIPGTVFVLSLTADACRGERQRFQAF